MHVNECGLLEGLGVSQVEKRSRRSAETRALTRVILASCHPLEALLRDWGLADKSRLMLLPKSAWAFADTLTARAFSTIQYGD
jgi:hypothetical protein